MKRKTVSLCMIARDEEASIGRAIKSTLALVDEIIVVDTGSRDNTRIIAEGYGARVLDHRWQDDFAAARNLALAEATCDWILVLDTDEQLQSLRPVEFQRLLHERHVIGYRVHTSTPGGHLVTQAVPSVRLFRNHPSVRYWYPVHEQILPTLSAVGAEEAMTVADSPLVIVHGGLEGDQRIQKHDRNLRLLRKLAAAYPEELYFQFQLANDTLMKLDEDVLPTAGLGSSRQYLESAWRLLRAEPLVRRKLLIFGEYLAANLASCLVACDRPDAAREVIEQARAVWGPRPHILLQAAAALVAQLESAPAGASREKLICAARRDLDELRSTPEVRTAGDTRIRTLYPLRHLGEVALADGAVSLASEYFEQALGIDGDYSFAWLGLAECARYAGDRKRALKLYLRAVTANEWNHRAWVRGTDLMEDLGFHDNAQSWRRTVTEKFPEHPMVSRIEPVVLA